MAMANFQTTFRQSQGRFRQKSATISPAARTPSDPKGQKHPHLLALGHEIENLIPSLRPPSEALAFFGDRNIRWWRSTRSGDDARDTPTRNLASSQVACVNFLLPLTAVKGALESLLKAFDPEVERTLPLTHRGFDSTVEFEWIGKEECLEGGKGTRGSKTTSADALIVADTRRGRCAYLFEWKCCEEYRDAEYRGAGKSGDTRRRRYASPYASPDSAFSGNVPMDDLLFDPFYQLMRFHLLGDRMVREREFGSTEYRVVVVCPDENTAFRQGITSGPLAARFPEARTVLDAMRAVLRKPDAFCMTSQATLLAAIRAAPDGASLREWDEYHRERYGW